MSYQDSVDRINLVRNGGFEVDTAGWDATGVTLEHQSDGADAGSGGCALVTLDAPSGEETTVATGTVSQALAGDAAQLRGRLLSFQIRVASATAGAVHPFISDDGGETRAFGMRHGSVRGMGQPDPVSGEDEAYETVRLEGFPVSDDASSVVFGVEVRAAGETRLDNASLVFGGAAVAPHGCVPAELLGQLAQAPAPTPQRSRAQSAPETKPTPGAAGRSTAPAESSR